MPHLDRLNRATARSLRTPLRALLATIALAPSGTMLIAGITTAHAVTPPLRTALDPNWAEPGQHEGPCPVDIKFYGRMRGDWGRATYRWNRSDGAQNPPEEIAFSSPKNAPAVEKLISMSWTIAESGEYWAATELLKDSHYPPPYSQPTRAFVKVTCSDATPVRDGVVTLGEEFDLRPRESVSVKELGITVRLLALANVTCKPGERCPDTPGPSVRFDVVDTATGKQLMARKELARRGESLMSSPSTYPWFVHKVDSDGRTFARFSVHRIADWCRQRASESCYEEAAAMTGNVEFCSEIKEDIARRRCNDRAANASSGSPRDSSR